MFRITLVLTVLAVSSLAIAADNCCPTDAAAKADAGQLPAGHPAVADGKLPAGHPPIADGKMPAGHPPIAEGKLPAGHPSLADGKMPAGHPAMDSPAATQPAVMGIIAIRANQGTEGGKLPAGAKVVVDLLHGRSTVQRFNATLDEYGVALIEDVPLTMAVTPHAVIIHNGVGYQATGEPMGPDQTQGRVEVKVFETTPTAPAWKITLRHIMIAPGPDGVTINDVIVVENPSDRTWVPAEDVLGSGSTITLTLPADAEDIAPGGGFFAGKTRVEGNKLITSSPVMAGKSRFALTYRLSAVNGVVRVPLVSPAACDATKVFLPNDDSVVTARELTDEGPKQMGSATVRVFSAAAVPAGHSAEIAIDGWKFNPVADADTHTHAEPQVAGPSIAPRLIAGLGVGGALLVGLVMVFLRNPSRKAG